jgi:hypothetical protein
LFSVRVGIRCQGRDSGAAAATNTAAVCGEVWGGERVQRLREHGVLRFVHLGVVIAGEPTVVKDKPGGSPPI